MTSFADPMVRVVYRCRKCGQVFEAGNEPMKRGEARNLFASFAYGRPEQQWTITEIWPHSWCPDGSVGVGELVGAEIAE